MENAPTSVRPAMRRAIEDAHAYTAPTVIAGAAVVLLVGVAFDLVTLRGNVRSSVLAFDLTNFLVCVSLYVAWPRTKFLAAHGDVVWCLLGILLGADSLVEMDLTGDLAYGGHLTLVFLAAGFTVGSMVALGLVTGLLSLGWLVVALHIGSSSAPPYGFSLVAGAVCAAVVFAARARSSTRLALLRERDRRRGERLRAALAVAESTIIERDRTEGEKERLRVALLQAQKLEAVGRLAGGVAHDINNVLATILSAAEMLLSDSHLDVAGQDDVMTIIASAKRGADFTRNLLAVGRRGKYRSDIIDPSDLVRGARDTLTDKLPPEVALEVHLDHGDARIDGDLSQLTQSIVNVCTNAVEAMPDGGTISVRTSLVLLEGAEAHRRAIVPGAYVALTVSDSGEGMDSKAQQLAFEPFYSTKPAHVGAGLGLPMAYGAARNHGGSAEIESQHGRGTTVTLHLPCADERGAVQESSAPEGSLRAGPPVGGRVLLVDDEASVRAVARRILERMDLTVVESENGRRALTAYVTEGPFDLVVADLAMPVMGGKELFGRLRAMSPDIRVLLVAVVGQASDALECAEAGGVSVIEKPYTTGGLGRAVRAALRPSQRLVTVKSA